MSWQQWIITGISLITAGVLFLIVFEVVVHIRSGKEKP